VPDQEISHGDRLLLLQKLFGVLAASKLSLERIGGYQVQEVEQDVLFVAELVETGPLEYFVVIVFDLVGKGHCVEVLVVEEHFDY